MEDVDKADKIQTKTSHKRWKMHIEQTLHR